MSDQEKLKQCFRESLELKPETKIEDMTYEGSPVWDSVGHMRLIANIETAFSIMLTTDQILDMNSFTKAREIVSQHGVSFAA